MRYNSHMESILTVQYPWLHWQTDYAVIGEVMSNCAELCNAGVTPGSNLQSRSLNYEQCKELAGLRQDAPYWVGIFVQVARGVIKRAQRSYDSFFRRVRRGETPGYPRFKPRSRYKALEIPELSTSMLKVRDNVHLRGCVLNVNSFNLSYLANHIHDPEHSGNLHGHHT